MHCFPDALTYICIVYLKSSAAQVVTALQGAAALSSDVLMNLSLASSSNPGIPPSSLSSFLRQKPAIAGVVLAEFDTCAWAHGRSD
jgi:nicastrin